MDQSQEFSPSPVAEQKHWPIRLSRNWGAARPQKANDLGFENCH
jgi:hypothetical protein